MLIIYIEHSRYFSISLRWSVNSLVFMQLFFLLRYFQQGLDWGDTSTFCHSGAQSFSNFDNESGKNCSVWRTLVHAEEQL